MEKFRIPPLPIYNTNQYVNFSPIRPEDLEVGQIYISEKLGFIIYFTYSNNYGKEFGYVVWTINGEYVSKNSSANDIYSIVTFLNSNDFHLLQEEIEAENPYSDTRVLLTPNGVKKIDESRIYRQVIENTLRRLISEGYGVDGNEDIDPFEEYQNDYPNDNFNVTEMTQFDLAKWCDNVGDFLYIYKGLRGWSIMSANTDEIVNSIVGDLFNCKKIEPTHEMDSLLSRRTRDFMNSYICVFKIIGTPDGDYYVIYMQDKM